jgi:3',5'-cyclic AMP phosphodiesterase CpdA
MVRPVPLILQISDLHFGTEVPAVVEALVELARSLAPELLVVSGDLTQRARPAEFAATRAFVDRLAVPQMLALPGNHDIPLFNLWLRAFAPYAHFRREFGDELEPGFESDDLLVLGVNTTRWWQHVDGHVSTAQIERVAARLRAARPEQLRVVVTHQPIHVSRARDRKDLLRGHERALPAWANAGADVVLGGHIHLPQHHCVDAPRAGVTRRVWCVQAGTATSSRVRWEAPNSVHTLRYERPDAAAPAPRCDSERWDFDAASGRFCRVESHTLWLDR